MSYLLAILAALGQGPDSVLPVGEGHGAVAPVIIEAEAVTPGPETVPETAITPEAEVLPPAAAPASPPEFAPAPSADAASLRAALERAAALAFSEPLELPGHRLQVVGSSEANASAGTLLEQMTRSRRAFVRLRAVEGWAQAGPPGCVEPLLLLACDGAQNVRQAAARVLAAIGGESVSTPVLALLNAQDAAFIDAAPDILPILSPVLGPVCLEMLSTLEASEQEVLAAAYALGVMRYPAASELLAEGVWSKNVSFSRTCVNALYQLNSGQAVSIWIRLLEHQDPEVAAVALQALGDSGAAEAKAAVIRAASGRSRSEEALQLRALETVRGWQATESIPSLIEVMANNPRLGPVANKFLVEKTRQDYGSNPTQWAEWWRAMNAPPSFDAPGAVAAQGP